MAARGILPIPTRYGNKRAHGEAKRTQESMATSWSAAQSAMGQEYGFMASLNFQAYNWMHNMDVVLKDRQLRHIAMSGTNDAGMTRINDTFNWGGSVKNTQTQGLSIHNQLRAGARWFDMRIVGNHVLGFHAAHMIDDINQFTGEHPGEIIIWWVKYMTLLGEGMWDSETTEAFYDQLEDISYRCPDFKQPGEAGTLDRRAARSFMDKNGGHGCVLIFIDGHVDTKAGVRDHRESSGIYKGRKWFPRHGYWAEESTAEETGKKQIARMQALPRDTGPNDPFFIMQWQCTTDFIHATITGIDHFAVLGSNPALYWHAVNAMSPENYPTVILEDYISQVLELESSRADDATDFPSGVGAEIQTIVIGINLYLASQNCNVATSRHPLLRPKVERRSIEGRSTNSTSTQDPGRFTGIRYANGTFDRAPPSGFHLARVPILKTGTRFGNGTVLAEDLPNPDY
ncbi:PLC-like phosphodiesterase [Cercophora newfieldiana]|uniref:PLC-like phosphodiesterase n=1 Tax=Cercophora newfieldiana TaxID=92897 RepID=A0AA39YNH8_9PEZI|nr:PLC-like phosphodiesterase [Cercophora newfieldiana]